MTQFEEALAEFLHLQAAEQTIIADEEALEAATGRTDDALATLLSLPAQSASQAATKLAAMSSHYDMTASGCRREDWSMIVAEVCRFGAADRLHRDWLAERNGAYAETNAQASMPEDRMDELTEIIIQLDHRIMAAPATTLEGLLVKMIVVLRQPVEGFEPCEEWVDTVLREAKELVGVDTSAQVLLASRQTAA